MRERDRDRGNADAHEPGVRDEPVCAPERLGDDERGEERRREERDERVEMFWQLSASEECRAERLQ